MSPVCENRNIWLFATDSTNEFSWEILFEKKTMKLSLHSLWYFSSDFDRCHWINGEIDSENSRKNLSNNWIDIGDFFLIFSYPLPLNKLNRWDIEHSQWLPRYLFLSFYSYSFASTNPSTVYVARCAVEFVVDRWLTDWDESISLWIFLDFSHFFLRTKKNSNLEN